MLIFSQILAWNGGGKSNYTDIINEDKYRKYLEPPTSGDDDKDPKDDIISLPGVEIDVAALRGLEKDVAEEFETSQELLREKVADISEKVNSLVEEELNDFFGRE